MAEATEVAEDTKSLAREKWILGQLISGTVQAANAPFCDSGVEGEDIPLADKAYIHDVARHVAKQCGAMQIEDLISILAKALEFNRTGHSTSSE